MTNTNPVRSTLIAAASLGALVAMSACSSGAATTSAAPAGGGTNTSAECAAFASYGDLKGKTITVYTSIASDAEAKPHIDSYKPFEKCTGATVKYEGSREFETQLPVRVKAGNAPDIAYIPQPGLLNTLVTNNPGKVIAVGDAAAKNLDEYYNKAWRAYGSVDPL